MINNAEKRKPFLYLLAGGAGIVLVLIDQLTKWAVRAAFSLFETKPLIPGVLDLHYITNEAAAFGLFKNQRWLFISVTAVVIIAGIVLLAARRIGSPLLIWAASLIISGGIGNMIDRLYFGVVTDFFHVRFIPFPYIFNVADSCVVIGAGIMILYFILDFVKGRKNQPMTDETNAE